MNMQNLARANLEDAKRRLEVARGVFQDGAYHFTVRLCQESVELALKAALRYINVDPPKWHDVGDVLLQNIHKFPDWFHHELPSFAAISEELGGERERSMYGDEDEMVPADELYSKDDGKVALQQAEQVLVACRRLMEIEPEEGESR